jgi:hypothetical protein
LRVVHTRLLIVGTKYEYSRSRCSVKVLVYEHCLIVDYVHSYINGLFVVYIVSVDTRIFGLELRNISEAKMYSISRY